MRKVAISIGLIESLALVVYSLAVALSHTSGATNVGGNVHYIQAMIYLIFAVCIGAVTYGLHKNSSLARTPFYLIQIFLIIAARPLLSSTSSLVVAVGVGIVILAVVGSVLLLLGNRASN